MSIRIRALALVLTGLLLFSLAGCGETGQTSQAAAPQTGSQEANTIDFFAMDTFMSLRAYGASDELLQRAAEAVYALEAEISTTAETSAVYALNRQGSGVLSSQGAYLLGRALDLCAQTDGALDLSVYPVVRAWGFTTQDYRVPDQAELDELLERVDYTRIELDPDGTVTLAPGMEIDLGSVAKGYTGDLLADILRQGGVQSAILDLGGNIQTLGSKPDGSAWRVAIQNPAGDGILGVIPVTDKAVVTSGGYERYFIDEDGNLWWHIMDPATGYPAQNGLISVTIVGEEGLRCDALATALFILGQQAAVDYWRSCRDFDLALVTGDGRLLLSPDLYAVFVPEESLGYSVEVLDPDAGSALTPGEVRPDA